MTTMEETQQHQIDLPIAGQEPAFLPHPLLDQLLESVIALSAELWVERDRRGVLEALLAEKGIVCAQEIERYEHTTEGQHVRNQAKLRLISRTLGQLKHQA